VLRLAGLRWRRPQQKPTFHNNSPIVIQVCLPRRCLTMNVYSGSTIPVFRRHVTIYTTYHKLTTLLSSALYSNEL
jgi:hypothetical protein